MILLEMEQRQRAQEKVEAGPEGSRGQRDPSPMSSFPVLLQLLWDLELLTGVGLGLFWPPWARFCSQRDQPQHAWNQCSQSWGRSLDGGCEHLVSRVSRGTV